MLHDTPNITHVEFISLLVAGLCFVLAFTAQVAELRRTPGHPILIRSGRFFPCARRAEFGRRQVTLKKFSRRHCTATLQLA